jgi:chitinase
MIKWHSARFIGLVVALGLAMALGAFPAAAARDRTPPTAPVLSVTAVGSRHVSLTWTPSFDNSPYIFYQVFVNGSPSVFAGQSTSATVQGLAQATPYTFTVRARDNGINWSVPSNAITVTTAFVDPGNDTQPPTTPASLTAFDGGCGEAYMNWTQSSDNVDPQSYLRYEIVVNGVARPESTVQGGGSTVAYAVAAGSNTFEVFAVDSAGNRSVPASLTLQMSPPC